MTNKNVFKYMVSTTIDLQLPEGSEFIHFGFDPMGYMCVWVLQPTIFGKAENRHIKVVPTGGVLYEDVKHIGTCVDPGMNTALVYHAFEVVNR